MRSGPPVKTRVFGWSLGVRTKARGCSTWQKVPYGSLFWTPGEVLKVNMFSFLVFSSTLICLILPCV
jgi:hypothetical protein